MKRPSRKMWRFQNSDFDKSVALASELGISVFTARLLANRGVKNATEARAYLYPSFDALHCPFKFADMSKAVERIRTAIARGEKICVYGDYDADGTTATALLLNTFRQLDVPADYYIPDRFQEGYGLTEENVQKIHKTRGTKLLITVDCGINSVAEVALANQLGIDVIVTDHHQPEEQRPAAHAMISSKVPGNEYPYDDLAGVGLAFKLAQGLVDDRAFLESQLDLVTLGTVVDMAPLTGENRILSRLGLAVLNKRERPGIHALCEVSGHDLGQRVDGQTVSFKLGPRINAAGRMDTADKVVELFTTESDDIAARIAPQLNKANQERQELERDIQDHAVKIIENEIDGDTVGIVVASDKWGEKAQGVVGIVASRLVKTYHKPAIVLCIKGKEATGSGRSIEGMNLADALVACTELLLKHGGHAKAAGLTLKTENIPKFKKAFDAYAREHLTAAALQPKLDLEFETHLPLLTLDTLKEFERFEPSGENNPRFRFGARRLKIGDGPTLMGPEKNHLQMTLTDGTIGRRAIAWRSGDKLVDFTGANVSLDVAFSPQINDWRGKQSVQLSLEDWQIRPQGREMKWDVFPRLEDAAHVKLVDRRNTHKRNYLLNLLARGESCIIYVQDAEMLDVLLTKLLPETFEGVARHDETTPDVEAAALLKQLEDGELRAIASNSTFSQLENVPFVKHFVFCHLTPSFDAFFKRCKPAFTAAETSYLHLIYGETDAAHLRAWIAQKYPAADALRGLYTDMRKIVQSNGASGSPEIEILDGRLGTALTVQTGLAIFEELQCIARLGALGHRRVKLLPTQKSGLSYSTTYLEGEWIKQTSPAFVEFQLKENIEAMWELIEHESQIADQSDSNV